MTRPKADVVAVLELVEQNLSVAEVARRSGIPRSTVRMWLAAGIEFCHYVRDLSAEA